MRLTLRTLLAYRDGVLDPADSAILERKIQESNTSRQISNRIDEAMIHSRLAPIPVDAREFGFDANMVAQFLDDTIPVESLPQMERTCLESDALLGEIGSCHQILSYAVSMPAPVSSQLRERIRGLEGEVPSSKSDIVSAESSSSDSHSNKHTNIDIDGRHVRIDGGVAGRRSASDEYVPVEVIDSNHANNAPVVHKAISDLRKTGIELNEGLGLQVPEYLTGIDRQWMRRTAMYVALILGLIFVATKAIGPTDTVKKLLSGSNTKPTNLGAETFSVKKEQETPESDIHESDVGAPPAPPNMNPLTNEASSTTIASKETKPTDVASKEVASTESASLELEQKKFDPPKPDPSLMKDLVPNKVPNALAQWLPESKASTETIVLAVLPQNKNGWSRLSPGGSLEPGSRVIVPPAMRTEFRIEPGIRWIVAGESDLSIARSNSSSEVQMVVGRALVFASPDGQSVDIKVGDRVFSFRFGSADSSCAVQVQNAIEPIAGVNFEYVKGQPITISNTIQIIGVQGSVAISMPWSKSQKELTLSVGQTLTASSIESEPSLPTELKEMPAWLRKSVERPIDQLAASDVYKGLASVESESLNKELHQLTNHRKPETAALASRLCMLVGNFEPIFQPDGVLNRKTQAIHWQSIFNAIPLSLGRNDNQLQFASAIYDAMESRADKIMTLIIPKSNEQLSSGADKYLVDALSSPSLDERVLAIHQLSMITGKSLGFHPEKNNSESIQQWRKALTKGEIRLHDRNNTGFGEPQ